MRDCCPTDNGTAHGLWFHVGLRLRGRRAQLGLDEGTVAAHLGVSPQRYQQFETGKVRIPAALLAQAGELLKVPLFYFFHDLPSGEDDTLGRDADVVFAVATDADRLDALIHDYLKLPRERQSYLLLLARALAQDGTDQ